MKRAISILVIAALLLSGCTAEPDSTSTSGTPTEGGTASTVGVTDYRQNVISLAAEMAVTYDAVPLIEHDPNQQIYIHIPKHDMDFFGSGLLPFFVYSLEPLDPTQIQLKIDCEADYVLQYMDDCSEYCHVKYKEAKQYPQYSLFDYQYYSLLGIDWKELALLKAQSQAALNLANENISHPDVYQSYHKIYEDCQSAYDEKTAEYQSKYSSLTAEDIPQFYLYSFYIFFPGVSTHEETIESAELVIGGESYPMNLGQIRLNKSLPQKLLENPNLVGLRNPTLGAVNSHSSAYNGCIGKIEGVFSFDAEKDLTITGISEFTYGTEMQILAARIRIKGQPDYFWDMQRPIEVEAGSHVDIDLYLRDSRFEEYDPCIRAYFLMDYTIGSKSYMYSVDTYFQHNLLTWDTFLMAFEGIDVGEYYSCMIAPYSNNWLQELPEEIRK